MKITKKKIAAAVIIIAAFGAFTKLVLFRSEFLYAGTIEATKIDLSSRVSSVIASVPAVEGQKVAAGEVLVKLAGEDLKLAAEVAEADFRRAEKLFKTGSMSQEAFDHLRFKRDDTAMRYEWTQIKAPVSGTVLNTYREAGEWVSPGMRLLTLADLQQVWAVFYVEQPMLARLSLGMQIDGILPEAKDRRFPGKIVRIADEAEFTPKNVQTRAERTRLVYGVKVVFDNKDEVLKPGMSIEARFPE